MHNFITGWPYVDHRNGNGLDNRRQNLRQATHAQNLANQKLSSRNVSGYKGVSRNRNLDRWTATISPAGRSVYLGSFDTPQDAARAYDAAAVEHYAEFARLNFPRRGQLMHALVAHAGNGVPVVILLNDEAEIEPWLLDHPWFDGLLVSSIVHDDRLASLPDEFPWEDLAIGPLLAADVTWLDEL